MPSSVLIPVQLKKLTNNETTVYIGTHSIKDMIKELEDRFPGMKDRLLDKDGNIMKFVNIYVNGEDIRFLNGMETVINDNSEISIVPASAGG
jgi:molybdopterin synthase sulfur carrier subunit